VVPAPLTKQGMATYLERGRRYRKELRRLD
jgi:hypothetical protein